MYFVFFNQAFMIYTWKKWKKFYEDLYQEYTSKWATWDEVIYDVCRKYYSHSDMSGIAAKLGVIGKSDRSGFLGFSEKDLSGLVDFFYKKREPLDKVFKKLKGLAEPLDSEKLAKIVQVHGELTAVFADLRKNPDTIRSFTSKYLHFHCPAVPIYDIRSEEVLLNDEWFPPAEAHRHPLPHVKGGDKRYAAFCQRFITVYLDLKKTVPEMGVKVVEYYLLEEYYRFKRHQ
jgi:hypothetical protein